MKEIPSSILHFANTLADAAGELIREYYRVKIGVDIKPDNSPVTQADRDAEEIMMRLVRTAFPDHGIIGEESGAHNADAEYVWVIDPIDGTRSFMAGVPLFTTLISLTHHGRPILGIIDQPVSQERWEGALGHPSMLNGAVIHTRSCAALSQATFSTTSPYLFANVQEAQDCEEVARRCRHQMFGGDAYMHAMVASGFVDLVVESTLKPYDFCALVPIVEGAGGIVTDWHGAPLTLQSDGTIITAGDKAVHQQALKLLSGSGKKAAQA